jgi:gluconolactonase
MSATTMITTDLELPEAPVPLPGGAWLVAELNTDRGTVVRITADGKREPIAQTGRPNGLAERRDGSFWVCESLEPAVLRLDLASGEYTRELEEVEGRPLLWPNDLCFGSDGKLYVTDSGLLVGDFLIDGKPIEGAESVKTEGLVFGYDPDNGDAWIIDEGLGFTNGIAFGPDGLLYANETLTGNVYRYRLDESTGRLAEERELFGNVNDPDWPGSGLRGPDGMAFSEDGRLWCTVFGQGDITVLNPDGSLDHRIKLDGNSPTNCTFGPDDGDTRLFVVEDEHGTLFSIDVGVAGLKLYD